MKPTNDFVIGAGHEAELIAVALPEPHDKERFERALSLTAPEKREKIGKFLHLEDRWRSLLADVLVRHVAACRLGCAPADVRFEYNRYGKPELADAPGLHFNASHAGNWIVAAFSDTPVGVDVEKIAPIELGIVERFFTKEEHQDLIAKPNADQTDYFFDLWTLKESYIKLLGKGFSLPPDTFAIRPSAAGGFRLEYASEWPEPAQAFFQTYDLSPEYKLAICSAYDVFPSRVRVWEGLGLCDAVCAHPTIIDTGADLK